MPIYSEVPLFPVVAAILERVVIHNYLETNTNEKRIIWGQSIDTLAFLRCAI